MTIDTSHGAAAGALERQAGLAALLAAGIADDVAAAAWSLLMDARRIVLLAHEHPDPDALGSALGLAYALAPLGKQCAVACADPTPAHYTFLPGGETVVTALPHEDFDLVVALDAGELTRYGALYTRHQRFFDHATILNIDHHVTSNGIGRVNIIDVRCAATAELLTLLLLNRGVALTREAAQCLLAGVITDTRSFEFDATTAQTLMVGAYLVGCGAIPQEIVKPVYRMKPLGKARLWARALDSAMGTTLRGRFIWSWLRQDDFQTMGANAEADDGLVNYLLDIDGVEVAALFKESKNDPLHTTRVSLRANEPYNAAEICAHFGGGGHVRAAGATIALPLDEAMAAVVAYVEQVMAPHR